MVEIKQWIEQYKDAVKHLFGGRIQFIGLQGSYGRGEAHEHSDIDVVLILDEVSLDDLKLYKEAIAELPHRPLICGFVSGREELARWLRPDLFQFYHDTTACFGRLEDIIPVPTAEDARRALLMGACNLYHLCSHSFLHAPAPDMPGMLYKAAFFVLQAKHYVDTGVYIKSRAVLAGVLTGRDADVLRRADKLKEGHASEADAEPDVELILRWTSEIIRNSR
jgi:predicted nucleotidyltransferase